MTPLGGGGGGFGLTSLLFWGVFAFIMVKAAQGVLGGGGGSRALREGDEPVSVAKLQVALLGSARGLQRDLERIASRADTSGPTGLHFILQGVVPRGLCLGVQGWEEGGGGKPGAGSQGCALGV